MIAFKGFNKDLSCTMGKGTYQYKVGETYKEDQAECARTGFHCVEEPIEVLRWYRDGRYCIVDARGDIHEDGDDKISCSEMEILKEITIEQLAAMECEWIRKHPERKCSKEVRRDTGEAREKGIVIVRGKSPKAAGGKGATIFLIREGKGKEIKDIGAYRIDGMTFRPGAYYDVNGTEVKACKKKS